MKYTTISYVASEDEKDNVEYNNGFIIKALGMPINVVNVARFETDCQEAIESVLAHNLYVSCVKDAKNNLKSTDYTDSGLYPNFAAYCDAIGIDKETAVTIPQIENKFIRAIAYCVAGLPTTATFKTKWDGSTELGMAIDSAMNSLQTDGTFNRANFADAVNAFCNQYLATNADSDIFKNCHCDFSNNQCAELLHAVPAFKMIWNKQGIHKTVNAVQRDNALAKTVILWALEKKFKFAPIVKTIDILLV